MRNILSNRRFGLVGSLVAIVVVSLVLAMLPKATAVHTSAENCANPPTTPTLNNWPITYDDENTPLCHDFRAIDAAVYTPNQDLEFSQSESDWQNGLNLNVGQEGIALMYIHNGAANNLPSEQTMARNVKIQTTTESNTGSTHRISVRMAGDNTNTVTESFTINTPSDAKLQVVANSGVMYDYEGNRLPGFENLDLGNSTFTLGDLDACFEYSLFLAYRFKVVKVEDQDKDTTLSIDKQVRNITDNTSFNSSVDAEKGDRVEYRVKVKNTGNEIARNVTVTDNGVSGISIDSDSTDVSGTSQSGDFPGTINLGDLDPNEEVTITYEGRVTEDECKTLTNRVEAQASNAPRVSDTASVRVKCEVDEKNPDLEIKKQVKNLDQSSSSFRDQVDARTGEDVRFRVTVTNTGEGTVNDAVMTDVLPSGFRFADNVDIDGDHEDTSFNNRTLRVDLGDLREDESVTIEFTAEVVENDRTTICNEASADGDNVDRVKDEACVRIIVTEKPGTPNIVQSKRAHNDTKKVDATSTHADRGDVITFTLTTTNNGSADFNNYVIRDDLSQVLPLADIVDLGGGRLEGNTLVYPAIDIDEGQTVTKTFKVRVKTSLAPTLSFQIKNTYGNTVIIKIPGNIVYEAPKTGAAGVSAAVFAGLLTAGAVAVRRGKDILGFIFA